MRKLQAMRDKLLLLDLNDHDNLSIDNGECLKVMKRVKKTRKKIITVKSNIAKVIPANAEDEKVFG